MIFTRWRAIGNVLLLAGVFVTTGLAADQVKIESGTVEGALNADSSVRIFRGIPFAAPAVGKLRWAPPQHVQPWTGVRQAVEFGPHCIQARVFNDIYFRSNAMSEDCLSLTVWAPAHPSAQSLPVYVWFYGGGFVAGASDEPRYDGESFAKHGIVVVNVNYRLGIFGFFAHPDLTRESEHKASGNYGLLDQAAAMQWVQKNITAFGGDPARVTIGGESAGSLSVSALMASPLSRDLLHQAIGESGAFLGVTGGHGLSPLEQAEKQGANFAASIGVKSLADLRAMPAEELLRVSSTRNAPRFWPIIDGYFLPVDVPVIYAEGKQSQVPLLAGWNADEARMSVLMAKQKPTAKSFAEQLQKEFGAKAQAAQKVYASSTDEEAVRAAGDLASDQFIVYGTWKWIDEQTATGKPVYRYEFDRTVPIPDAMKSTGFKTLGSAHAAEIEYVFNALNAKKADWQPEDFQVAKTMNDYWSNFIIAGDPNASGMPKWPDFTKTHEVMHINVESHAAPEQHRDRYEFLDSLAARGATH